MQLTRFVSKSNSASMATGVTALLMSGLFMSGLLMTGLLLQVGCSSGGGSGGGGGGNWPVATYDTGIATGTDGGVAADSGTAGVDAGGCPPKTCASAGANCGTMPDGCGGTLNCGQCTGGQVCGAGNICGNTPCQKQTCQQVSAACGTATDGCGGTQSCGDCSGGQACQSNQCICQPKTCQQVGATCGKVDNGCGGSIDCGVCATCELGCPQSFSCNGGACTGGNVMQLKLNMQTVPVSGIVTLNAKTPQFGQYCDKNSSSRYMRVRFVEVKKGYSFEVLRRCNSTPHNFAFETVVFPGTYKVTASGYTTGYSNLPTTQQVIYDNLTLTKPTSGITLNITTVPVSGVVTLNGKTPQFGQYCDKNSSSRYMRVRFSEVKKGYSFEVLRRCNSTPHNFAFETVVFPGTYKVSASGYTAGYSNLPTTQQVIFDTLTLTKPTSGITLNITTVPVSGIVTLNGKTPQFGQYCDKNSSSRYMRVRFSEVKKGYSFEILRRCNSAPHNFAFETVVFPGTYKVSASGYTAGYSNLPTTPQVIYDSLTLTKPTSGVTLNVTTVPVSGVVTLNGKTPQFGQYCDKNSSSRYMRVRFSEVKKGYSFEVLRRCNSAPHNFAFETVVFPGTYRVSASGYTAGYSNLPTTPQVIYENLTLTKPTSGVTLNVTTVPVSGVVTLNGKTPQFGQYCDKNSSSRYMRVRFSEVKKGYSFEILRRCNSTPHNFSFETVVFPGTYKVTASGYTAGYSNLPTTPQIIYDNLTLTKPTSGVTLNVTTVSVAGVVTLNGKVPQFGQYCDKNSSSRYMRVRFSEVKKGYSFEILRRCNSAPHDFSFSTVVYPGVYQIRVSGYTSGYSNLPTTMQTIVDKLEIK